jgi:RNA polymerase sigma factor (sigma-70 family)
MTQSTTCSGSPPRSRDDFSDRDLIDAAGRGDEQAFAALFERHVDAVRGFLAVRVGAQLAEELAAETFAAAWSSLGRFDDTFVSARPWVYGIATNVLRRHRESELQWQQSIVAGTQFGSASQAPPALAEVDPAILRALARLDARDREILVLVALGELKAAEAGALLGISAVAARIRLHRARRRIIAILRSDDHA